MKTLVFNGWAAGPETWSLCTFAHDWLFDYIEQLDGLPLKVMDDADKALLVGFSMGGSMAMKMFLQYPEKVCGLVLVSSTPCMMEHRDQGWSGMSERRLNALRFGTNLVFGNDPSPIYAPQNLERGLEYLLETDLRSSLAAVPETVRRSFPVAILQSERDGIVRPANAEFLKGVFPQATVTLVPGGEHVLPVAACDLVDDAVFRCGGERGEEWL